MELKILDERISGMTYGSEFAAACDLRACTLDPLTPTARPLDYKINLHPGHKVKIGAGFAMHLDYLTCGLLLPRSGLGTAGVVRIANQTGLIDPDFQGEVTMSIENQSDDVFVIEPLARIAQLVVVPFLRPTIDVVTEFTSQTGRGIGGFGSTGAA